MPMCTTSVPCSPMTCTPTNSRSLRRKSSLRNPRVSPMIRPRALSAYDARPTTYSIPLALERFLGFPHHADLRDRPDSVWHQIGVAASLDSPKADRTARRAWSMLVDARAGNRSRPGRVDVGDIRAEFLVDGNQPAVAQAGRRPPGGSGSRCCCRPAATRTSSTVSVSPSERGGLTGASRHGRSRGARSARSFQWKMMPPLHFLGQGPRDLTVEE